MRRLIFLSFIDLKHDEYPTKSLPNKTIQFNFKERYNNNEKR